MTRFRPCIDLHGGRVKQIVGSTLRDHGADPKENFVSDHSAGWYAKLYKEDGLYGGHVIMLGMGNEASALEALQAFPGGLQIGGGVNAENAERWLSAGAAKVIVTSALFDGYGRFSREDLTLLLKAVGRERLVLDLSCKAVPGGGWCVAMNRWQTLTDLMVVPSVLDELGESCSEFLIHAVDVEGKCEGVDVGLVEHLASWGRLPMTYAGGARSLADLMLVDELSDGKLDVTIGSALDLFGGTGVSYSECVKFNARR
jgi:phosphoribosylformimino-5-aminoimidazole carboxamide ribotide isomerase